LEGATYKTFGTASVRGKPALF